MATRNFVPRKDGEGSIGKSRKHWGAAYIEKIFVKAVEVLGGETENDAQPATVGWVKSRFQEMVKNTFSVFGVRYVLEKNGYLCLGRLFGDLKILWGEVPGNISYDGSQVVEPTLPFTVKLVFFSGANVEIKGGRTNMDWVSEKPSVSTIVYGNKISITSNYFVTGKQYWVRWLVISI